MRQLIIDPEFRDKIPPLSADEFSKLEENIIADREVREPLVCWNDTIIDGHHRWKIIQKHPEITYKIKRMEFSDKWAAIVWMCRNQLGRRNITEAQRMVLTAQQYEAQKKTVGGTGANQHTKEQILQSEGTAKRSRGTAEEVAKQNDVSTTYVERAVRFSRGLDEAEKVSPGIRDSVLSGEVKAPKRVISEIRNMPEEKKERVVEAIINNVAPYELKAIVDDKPYVPVPNATPVIQTEEYNADDFKEELMAIIDNADSCFKQTLVLAHSEMLDTEQGRNVASGVLMLAHNMIQKYENIVKGGANRAGV